MRGTSERPRLVVIRSLNNLSALAVDDGSGRAIFSLSSASKELKQKLRGPCGNVKAAAAFGEFFAQKAREKGLTKIVFDRAGYLYHGRVKAFAEALRKGGMEF